MAADAATADFYVAPGGKDTWSGGSTPPNPTAAMVP